MKLGWVYVGILLITLTVNCLTKQRNLLVDWEKFETCQNFNNKEVDLSGVEIYRDDINSIALKGMARLNVDILSGPLKITATFTKITNGGSYPILNYEIADLCDKIGQKGTEWEPYIRGLVPVPPDTCPVYKTNFTLGNMKSDTTNTIALTKDMVGKYQVILEVFRPESKPKASFPGFEPQLQRVMCYVMNFNVITD